MKVKESIAFYPALIAVAFLALSYVMIAIDFSDWGKSIKSEMSWLSLKDASTARSIISTVAGALISLTVFSFSMVMIVLNQAASQMSNRVLSSMIENRFQQTVLGFYIGTIVYALFLLTTIRDVDSGIYVPALSIYLLILLTVIDIFLFIYFLDYVTQSVKYETVINRVKDQTLLTLKDCCEAIGDNSLSWNELPFVQIKVRNSGYFQSFNKNRLLEIAADKNLYITFLHKQTTFLIEGLPFANVYSASTLDEETLTSVASAADFFTGQPINVNHEYGFRQLSEIAIKALSPGINDPATAVLALNALLELFATKLNCQIPSINKDENDIARIFIGQTSFEDLFDTCIRPIYAYGKNDQYIQDALLQMMHQLKSADYNQQHRLLFESYESQINRT